mgnify:CR=1 FL=1|jgi:hypothetical protein|tara:strand:+ start:229 stop:597 length:369 start_codon:yes stop_codon:yes gene_type:complete
MKKLITILALGLITLSLTAQTKVRVIKNKKGTHVNKHRSTRGNIINQAYYSNYSNYSNHNNRRYNRPNNYIWVEGHWKWSRRYNDYIWVDGRWIKRRQGRTWVVGSYNWNNGIKIWINGCWR